MMRPECGREKRPLRSKVGSRRLEVKTEGGGSHQMAPLVALAERAAGCCGRMPSGVGVAQDPAVTPGLAYACVLVVVVVVPTGNNLG